MRRAACRARARAHKNRFFSTVGLCVTVAHVIFVNRQSSIFVVARAANSYMDNIDRLTAADYVPTDEDILRVRAKTTGITEIMFTLDDIKFRLVDVGGQVGFGRRVVCAHVGRAMTARPTTALRTQKVDSLL